MVILLEKQNQNLSTTIFYIEQLQTGMMSESWQIMPLGYMPLIRQNKCWRHGRQCTWFACTNKRIENMDLLQSRVCYVLPRYIVVFSFKSIDDNLKIETIYKRSKTSQVCYKCL